MAESESDSGEGEGLELKMTSMIDVVFLLLIFFIVTLKIPRKEGMIETRLPEPTVDPDGGNGGRTIDKEFEPIVLKLRKSKSTGDVETYVGDVQIRSSRQLANHLQRFKALEQDKRVVLDCGDRVPYKNIVEAISVIRAVEMPMAFKNVR